MRRESQAAPKAVPTVPKAGECRSSEGFERSSDTREGT
jgi:hypothetical protein